MVLTYFLFLLFAATALLAKILWPFLFPLILAYFFTLLSRPVHRTFTRYASPYCAAFCTCTLIVLLLCVVLWFFVMALYHEALHLYQSGVAADLILKFLALQRDKLATIFEQLAAFGLTFNPESANGAVNEAGKTLGLYVVEQLESTASHLMEWILKFCVMMLTIFYLLAEEEKLGNFLLQLSPLPEEHHRRLLTKMDATISAVLVGNGITSIIQGVLCGVLFAVLDLGPPVIWGSIMAVLALLPILGIGLVLLPASFLLLLQDKLESAAIVLIFFVVVHYPMEYLVKPKMVGEKAQLHGMMIFLGFLGGVSAFGIMGLVYGPLIIATFLTLGDIYLVSYDKYIRGGQHR